MVIENDEKDSSISQVGMFVIDVLRDDIETISLIINRLNNGGSLGWRFAWPHDFTVMEIIQALKELIEKDLVTPLREDEDLGKIVYCDEDEDIWDNIDFLWFELTERGRQAWNNWDDPPIEEENESP